MQRLPVDEAGIAEEKAPDLPLLHFDGEVELSQGTLDETLESPLPSFGEGKRLFGTQRHEAFHQFE